MHSLSSDTESHKPILKIAEALRMACNESTNEVMTGLVLSRGGCVGADNKDKKVKPVKEDMQHRSLAYLSAK